MMFSITNFLDPFGPASQRLTPACSPAQRNYTPGSFLTRVPAE